MAASTQSKGFTSFDPNARKFIRPFPELRLETEISPKSPVLSLSLGISGFLNSVSDGFCEKSLEIGLARRKKLGFLSDRKTFSQDLRLFSKTLNRCS